MKIHTSEMRSCAASDHISNTFLLRLAYNTFNLYET